MFSVAIIVLAISVTLGTLVLPSSREGRQGLEAPPVYWVWGAPAWRAFCRSLPILTVSGVFLVLCGGVNLVAPEREGLWVPLGLAWVACAVLALAVGVSARPRMLVPRQLREQPGYVRDLLDERKRTRASQQPS